MEPPLAALLVVLVSVSLAADVCYDDVGCFTTDYPWSDVRRPFPNLPQPPEEIPTNFYLYTRTVPKRTAIFYNGTTFGDFSAQRERTTFVIHGFQGSGDAYWMIDIKDLLLQQYDYNVILVDWAVGSSIPYIQAAANAQLVGRQVALLVHALCDIGGAAASDFHLMSHSLGSQVAGYAGARIPGLARITGLDPGQPYFEGTQPEVHLDSTDAEFVDIIHTDGRDLLYVGFGFQGPCGDVDFYPNGGKSQPGCGDFEANVASLIYDLETNNIDEIGGIFNCPHDRSHELFIATLTEHECPFVSFPCKDYAEYESGECQRLDRATIGRMGMDAEKYNLSGNYYLQTTGDNTSFCMHYLEVELQLSEDQQDGMGNLVFVIETNTTASERLLGWSSGTSWSSGTQLRTTVHSPIDPAQMTSLKVTLHGQGAAVSPPLLPRAVKVTRVDSQLTLTSQDLCTETETLQDKETMVLRPCQD
ncbi:inactive pancreatic lipase-related protein 1-like isoform X4 [Amphibalanus amphitrite]|uniref:inactive pancreatic lipase-related protein 1-like isoform X4 n=1 Tax=Amphibalanus amphitrite TaxID=1232801 RepID=UPI001C92A3C9|nr:inactive pancreatic lipase-related protein 1-like isoform X4 [Amphibalanus amphitrite]